MIIKTNTLTSYNRRYRIDIKVLVSCEENVLGPEVLSSVRSKLVLHECQGGQEL